MNPRGFSVGLDMFPKPSEFLIHVTFTDTKMEPLSLKTLGGIFEPFLTPMIQMSWRHWTVVVYTLLCRHRNHISGKFPITTTKYYQYSSGGFSTQNLD